MYRNTSIKTLCLAALQVTLICMVYIQWVYKERRLQYVSKGSDFYSNKPRLVFGILSLHTNNKLRDAQRNTWLSSALLMQEDIPFRFTYKFLIDFATPETIEESIMHNDILFLNVTNSGKTVKFGEELYVWMKYVYDNYPDSMLAAKMDDDVFLCVPHVFHRLNSFKSSKLYYGWAHGSGPVISIQRRVDEMFVVFGRSIIERIVNRQYCNNTLLCDVKKQLTERDFADKSLAMWLSIYSDIDFHPDNNNIHFNGSYGAPMQRFIRNDFCDSRILFHKSSPESMRKLHFYNRLAPTGNGLPGSVTGALFSGEVTRELPPDEIFPKQNFTLKLYDSKICTNWAVVTTIFPPSEALFQIVSQGRWCVVIVADKKTPAEKVFRKSLKSNDLVYLSLQDQDIRYPFLSKTIPRNHFGRKNIGYLYAIQHNAKVIWDFDDDNIGTVDIQSTLLFVTACKGFTSVVLNPYPYFGVDETFVWPRGIPLQLVKDNNTVPEICDYQGHAQIGVIQSLANEQPDVDAIYRLTRKVPFNFTATAKTHKQLLVPTGVYAPFNAQATLWFKPAFDLLALPLSVNGRVSDIWRAYIAQYFMHKKNLHLVFSIPFVRQKRNEHDSMKDFNAENDLYEKSDQLVELLSSNQFSTKISLLNIYEELYKRNYIEAYDLDFVKVWMKTLHEIMKPE